MKAWSRTYEETAELLDQFGSPLYAYDEAAIAAHSERYQVALASVGSEGCKNYYAVKALPNPHILRVLKRQGMGFDCSSIPEIHLAQMAGADGEDIIYTSNNTSDEEFDEAVRAGVMINFDDLTLVQRYIAKSYPAPSVAFCRYNPGDLEFGAIDQSIIGKPSEAKYGMPREQIVEAYRLLRDSGVTRFGLHTMLLSNERDHRHHLRIARAMFELAHEIAATLDITFEMINLGGGFGVGYRPDDTEFDVEVYGRELTQLYQDERLDTIGAPHIITENGRWVTADAGYLLTRVINRKNTHRHYVGVDASMSNLMRPAMYGAYHHVTILSSRPDFDETKTEVVDMVGSLCENNDKFAIQRELPQAQPGDIAIIHTAGAHAHAMGFQYNAKLRSAEVLLTTDGPKLIRRAETEADYFATIIHEKEEETTDVPTN